MTFIMPHIFGNSLRHGYKACARGNGRIPAVLNPSTSSASAWLTMTSRRHTSCHCHGGNRNKTAYIALGSNLGDRVAEIEKACTEMDRRGIRVKRTSSLWETKPMYVENQDRFVNGACEVCTNRPQPYELFRHPLTPRSGRNWVGACGPAGCLAGNRA